MTPTMAKKLQEAADRCTIKDTLPSALFRDGGHFMHDELMPVVEMLMEVLEKTNKWISVEDPDRDLRHECVAIIKQAKEMLGEKPRPAPLKPSSMGSDRE